VIRVVAAALVAVSLSIGASAACRQKPEAATDAASGDQSSRLAKPFPITPFDAEDMNGARVSFSDWKGQIVVVNVWATWCAPCRRELPVLSALQARYRNRVKVLGLLNDTVSDDFARQFITRAGITFPVVRSTFEIERRLPAVVVIPMTFVIDPAGQLVSTFSGEADATELERELVRLGAK
jgi:thiol-disulfide isomerase/thioredoxin